jgi:Transposase
VSRRQVIDDQEHERVHDRVAAVDVAKDSGMVCTRQPHPARPGARQSTVWAVTARTGAIRALGAQLKDAGVELVTLESTSDYWRIWFFVLEACGLAVQLVSAAQAKNLPGRPKTDKLDAQWLARLTELGLLRPSFVPPKAIRDLRDYTRARIRLVQERTRCWQRLEKLLEGALVKVSSVASSLTTLSAQDMIKAMIAGQRDPEVLAGLARRTMKAKHDALVQARGPGRGGRAGAILGCAGPRPGRGERGPHRHLPGERHGRIARSTLVIIWHLLVDPAARFTDLGPGYHQARTETERKLRNHIRQIQALGFTVALTKTE